MKITPEQAARLIEIAATMRILIRDCERVLGVESAFPITVHMARALAEAEAERG